QSLHWLWHLRGLPTEQATTSKPPGKAAKTTRRGRRRRGPHRRPLSRKSIGLTLPIVAATARSSQNNVSFCAIRPNPPFFHRLSAVLPVCGIARQSEAPHQPARRQGPPRF